MLPDIGAGELLLIGIVALVVVGPKDLPLLMRRLGQFTARLRGMAAEFRASFDEMGRQSELDELRKEVEALRSGKMLDDEMGRTDAQSVMREIETGLSQGDIQMHPPMGAPYAGSLWPIRSRPPAPRPRRRRRRAMRPRPRPRRRGRGPPRLRGRPQKKLRPSPGPAGPRPPPSRPETRREHHRG
jgi:sec-independent protein translocase protein TatB